MSAASFLAELAGQGPIRRPVALVVAHPDDETIAAGATLARFLDLTLIHITDGAPQDPAVARAHGFTTREAYAAARAAELTAALAAACARPVRSLAYGIPDGEVPSALPTLAARLAADLLPMAAVITHPYEGGHSDHDACAEAVQTAVARLAALTGRAPARLEFASYYRRGALLRPGRFWPDRSCPELVLHFAGPAAGRRAAALACFTSQAGNLRYFPAATERYRAAPDYDFSRPPPPAL